MMTAAIEVLTSLWPFLVAAAGVVFGMFRHQQAKSATAKAKQTEAEATAHAARNDAALAQANQAGAQAGADNAKVRRDEDAAADSVPDANSVLHDEWGK